MPKLPKVETNSSPTDEQLTHVLEITPMAEPEKSDAVLILKRLECLNRYRFILTTIPSRVDIIVERMNPTTASSGK